MHLENPQDANQNSMALNPNQRNFLKNPAKKDSLEVATVDDQIESACQLIREVKHSMMLNISSVR